MQSATMSSILFEAFSFAMRKPRPVLDGDRVQRLLSEVGIRIEDQVPASDQIEKHLSHPRGVGWRRGELDAQCARLGQRADAPVHLIGIDVDGPHVVGLKPTSLILAPNDVWT